MAGGPGAGGGAGAPSEAARALEEKMRAGRARAGAAGGAGGAGPAGPRPAGGGAGGGGAGNGAPAGAQNPGGSILLVPAGGGPGRWPVPGWAPAQLPGGFPPPGPPEAAGRPDLGLGLGPGAGWGGVPLGLHGHGWMPGVLPLVEADADAITVADRRVRLAPGEQPSLYAMCRRWVRNDPRGAAGGGGAGGDPAEGPGKAPNGLEWTRPPEPPNGPPVEDPGPVPPPDWAALLSAVPEGQAPGVPELKRHHLEHWREVRRVRQKYRAKKLERYHGRLVNLLTSRRQLAPGVAAEAQEAEGAGRAGGAQEPPEAERPAAGADGAPTEGETPRAPGGTPGGAGGDGEQQD